jgi:hypothetical protein
MKQGLFSIEEVVKMIQKGDGLLLAGNFDVLSRLPAGNWIAGTTPFAIIYPENKTTIGDKIFVSQLPDFVTKTVIKEYDQHTLKEIYNDAPDHGLTLLIIPFASEAQLEFATSATTYENFAAHPVCGWISWAQDGNGLVISGNNNKAHHDKAVAMHIEFPDTKYAELHIFNPYVQGDGDDITFDFSGSTIKNAYINGKKQDFAEYLRKINFDKNKPFVANYSGAMINVSCSNIIQDTVSVYAPVFPTIDYRIGAIDETITAPELINDQILFALTCIVNYSQSDFCNKYLKKMNGLVTYGEIGYQLLNQTTVFVTIGNSANK